MPNNLSKIEQVELREAWGVEPEFTHWLSHEENLDALGEELGLELSLLKTEADVGDFNVDILAEEGGTGAKVIIENQLEVTNHDHLGKLITYASGHDAAYVIWIFKQVREEHRQAIDWLNEHTNDDVNFFGVKLELWRIADSAPAPKFDVVSRPNAWAKTVKKQSTNKEPSLLKLRQLEFWTQLCEYAKTRKLDIRLRSPRPQHWMNISIGSSEAHVAFTINTRELRIGCELYIRKNRPLFDWLYQQKDNIENELGAKLKWIKATKATRILETTSGFDITTIDENFTQYFDWLLDRAVAFKKTFAPKIKEFQKTV